MSNAPRFHLPQPLLIDTLVNLPEPLVRHLKVLRLQPGEHITLFNGAGGEYDAVLERLDKRDGQARVASHADREAELPYAITLAQGLPEAGKMDWIIEKAVELGVQGFAPLAAQRSVVRLSAERAERRMEHWQGIIVAACEQCGRNRVPQLAAPSAFDAWATTASPQKRILFSPRASQSLTAWAQDNAPQDITFAIGPEGGFSDAEEALAERHGCIVLSLGSRVLRTETAGLAAIASLNAIWDRA